MELAGAGLPLAADGGRLRGAASGVPPRSKIRRLSRPPFRAAAADVPEPLLPSTAPRCCCCTSHPQRADGGEAQSVSEEEMKVTGTGYMEAASQGKHEEEVQWRMSSTSCSGEALGSLRVDYGGHRPAWPASSTSAYMMPCTPTVWANSLEALLPRLGEQQQQAVPAAAGEKKSACVTPE